MPNCCRKGSGLCAAIVAWLTLLVAVVPGRAQTTPAENEAAFHASAATTNLSYHWDSFAGGVPNVAVTPRTTLPYDSDLTTIIYDPVLHPELYQQKVIGGVTYDSVLVGTFTRPNNFWNQASGTTVTLTFNGGLNTIFPYVTVGDDLRNYLQSHYFPLGSGSPGDADVALRITQSLGLFPGTDLDQRGLAFFWVPVEHIARSGYSPAAGSQVPALASYPDGSFQATDSGEPAGFVYVDFANSQKLYATNTEFVTFNQAQTTFPWTAMGYTYNWNVLQDGSSPLYGNDPLHVASFFGLSEFVVSGGSQVLLESWLPYAEFDSWIAVPEPSGVILLLFAGGLIGVAPRRSVR